VWSEGTLAALSRTVLVTAQMMPDMKHMLTPSLPETKHFIYFYLGHCAILLFKTQ
jgi:hypothetical protein